MLRNQSNIPPTQILLAPPRVYRLKTYTSTLGGLESIRCKRHEADYQRKHVASCNPRYSEAFQSPLTAGLVSVALVLLRLYRIYDAVTGVTRRAFHWCPDVPPRASAGRSSQRTGYLSILLSCVSFNKFVAFVDCHLSSHLRSPPADYGGQAVGLALRSGA